MPENTGRTMLTSDSGSFEVDSEGRLLHFIESENNTVERRSFLPVKCDLALRHLHIPEGVRWIGPRVTGENDRIGHRVNGVTGLLILEDISFPKTLISIGNSAFSSCLINRIVFPPSLKKIGCGTFMSSLIEHLEIRKDVIRYEDSDVDPDILENEPGNRLYYGGRSFKESTVVEVKAAGKDFAVYRPGNERIGIPPETRRLSVGDWIKRLMPEAEVIHISN